MKRRRLSPGEKALWKRATRDVRRSRPPTADEGADLPIGETTPEATFPTRAASAPPTAAPAPAAPPTGAKRRKLSPFAAGDPALDRRARRGTLLPERTLDLHGLRQAAARVRLEAFLAAAAADGVRCVLVVTGKGPPGGVLERDPHSETSPRGVLRARFFEWLEEEPLRALVARAAEAGPAHGGRGAFYVFLKGRRRG